jgi:tetratricopeptide (TPR) repeat protein
MSDQLVQPGAVAARPALRDVRGRPYEPAVSPSLRVLLFLVFAATALLGLTGVYLLSIRLLEWARSATYTNQFTLWMFIAHIGIGVLITLPFLWFGGAHWWTARHRKNRLAVKLGLTLFAAGVLIVLTGYALVQLEGFPQLPVGSWGRTLVYLLHVIGPVAAVVIYILHRRAGPDIQWRWAYAWGGFVGVFVVVMAVLHQKDPRQWYVQGPREGEVYFQPSLARTADANFIPASALMMDEYCKKCHPTIYNDHFHSAHKFSSFNNPPYLFSVLETRKMGMERDKNVKASRWCAGCHDPVPFFSGAFDDPNFDVREHPTAQAGITCTVCHAITNVNSTVGNSDYTIEEPTHYPFAYSDNPFLQWVNNQVVKAKPDFHKKTFLKPFHKSARKEGKYSEFCSTCHKVSLPVELNHYKEFLRGQNHHDPYLLSGVSGAGARSFYSPPVAKTSCQDCHMPLKPSNDFGARDFDDSGTRKVHDHLFPAANTGLPWLLSLDPVHADKADGLREAAQRHADFLRGTDPEGKERKLRIDLFGIKEGGGIGGKLVAPLRPELPALKPGQTYLVEVVIRTLNIGHPFTQGTVDSNEVWVDFTARSGARVIGRSGALEGPDDTGPLDAWAHRVNVLMLDRNGNRINRRNPQDIFTPLYDHQIPPGAAQVVHYALAVPADVKEAVNLKVRLRYRKFDFEYMTLVHESAAKVPKLPVVDICEDEVTLPLAGLADEVPAQTSPIKPPWQRWNDYGIGCFLEGGAGQKKGEFRQAVEAFQRMTALDVPEARAQGYLNLARVLIDEGALEEAVKALNAAQEAKAPWWLLAWFNGLVNVENARNREDFDAAITDFEKILDPANQERERKFDFTNDYVVINRLANTLFKRSQFEGIDAERRDPFLLRGIEQWERTLQLDREDLDAHYGLGQSYTILGRAMPVIQLPQEEPDTREATLLALSATLRDGNQAREKRLEAAARLGRAVTALGKETLKDTNPKRPRIEGLIGQLRPFFHGEQDGELRAAAAHVLGRLHVEAHAIFKPDDVARSRTVQMYRRNHPAASHAAESIVIYDLNRKGAPGL